MFLSSPVEQYINNVTFTTDLNVNDQFNRGDYISITVPLQFFNTSMIVLDGSDLSGLTWHVNMTQSGASCPQGLTQKNMSGLTLCGQNANGCQGTLFSALGLSYSKLVRDLGQRDLRGIETLDHFVG